MTSASLDLPRVVRAARWSAPPVVAWLGSSLITWWVARAADVAYWSVPGRERWDSLHYLSISRGGYELFNCWDRAGYREAGFRDVLCGNVAWFPGYPMAIRMLSATGMSYDVAAIVISEVAFLGCLMVLWWLIGSKLTWATGLTMAIAAVFTGGVYFHAAFPVALGTLAMMVTVVGIKRGSWVLAAASGFVATACHPVGAVVAAMLLASVFFAWRDDTLPVSVAKAAGSAAIAYSGELWAKWMMWTGTGNWNAYADLNKSSYGQGGLRNPLHQFERARHFVFTLNHPGPDASWLLRHSIAANYPQLWINLGFVFVVVAGTAWRFFRERRLEVEEWAALLILGGVFVTPFLAGAQMSWYRNHAQMLVGLILVRRLPRWLQIPILVVFAVQYVFLSAMFFMGILV